MVPDTISLLLLHGNRHDNEAFLGVAVGLERAGQEVMGREGTEGRIHHVDVGERESMESHASRSSLRRSLRLCLAERIDPASAQATA